MAGGLDFWSSTAAAALQRLLRSIRVLASACVPPGFLPRWNRCCKRRSIAPQFSVQLFGMRALQMVQALFGPFLLLLFLLIFVPNADRASDRSNLLVVNVGIEILFVEQNPLPNFQIGNCIAPS